MLEENGTEDLLSRRPFVEDRTNERERSSRKLVWVEEEGVEMGRRGGNIEGDSSARARVCS